MTTNGEAPAPRSLHEAGQVADEVLFPAAATVDAAARVPESHLELLAERGFYGLAAPEPLTTLDPATYPAACRVVETLAGGCLTTAFVWVQHHGAVTAAANTSNAMIRETCLPALARGRRKAGVAVGAAVRPGPPSLRVRPAHGGWLLDGYAPWVTGWGMIDTLYVAGRDEHGTVVFALLDIDDDSISVEPLELIAAQASGTVAMRFADTFVPQERVTSMMPQQEYLAGDAESVRFNANLALGVASRAITLMGDDGSALAPERDAARTALLRARPEDVPSARAACSELALRAAAALTAHVGGRAVLRDSHAQRLVREATFLLVFGTRPAIRASLLGLLTRPGPQPTTGDR